MSLHRQYIIECTTLMYMSYQVQFMYEFLEHMHLQTSCAMMQLLLEQLFVELKSVTST